MRRPRWPRRRRRRCRPSRRARSRGRRSTAIGMIPATKVRTIEAAAHLDNQIEARETGFEATHDEGAAVALADEQAHRREDRDDHEDLRRDRREEVHDRIERDRTLRRLGVGDVGHEPGVDRAVGRGQGHERVVVARMTQMRLLWAHSRSSLRNSGPKPAKPVGGDAPGGPGGDGDRGGHAARSLVLTRRRKTSSSPRRTRWFSVTICPCSAANRVIAAWTVGLAPGATRTR